MSEYTGLNRAQLSYEYLHTNSTTHEFLFGALAELLDNARDANATKMEVFTVPNDSLRGGYMLCFLDNGEGMDPVEANGVITFGKSSKRVMDSKMIGQYGNGLKSGAMRIANDFILFTKKEGTMSCIFLSRTFHEEENLQEVIVPLPSFDAKTQKPYSCNTVASKYRYKAEMDIIYKYSPFKTHEEFMSQFEKITGEAGTLVIVYNMKLLDTGAPELICEPSTSDIVLSTSDEERLSMMPERYSFRAYTSVLYSNPYMKVYIEDKKVRTKLLHHSLNKPQLYKYSSTRFKDRSKKEAIKAAHDSDVADMKAREAESKAKQLEKKPFDCADKNFRQMLRKAQESALELREEAKMKKKIAAKKQKDEKLPKALDFIFGLNLERRTHDGLFIYNCSRLIKMYQKVGPQLEGGLNCSGVVGIVDVPYQVLEPTHNKQDFADAKEYRHLLKVLGEHMEQYWKDIDIARQGITQFWENFGYLSHNNWQHPPSEDPKFIRRRAMQTNFYVQCDSCLKWRVIPFSSTNIKRTFVDHWVCEMNTDHSYNKCSLPEQKHNIPEGKLLTKGKDTEEMKEDLEKKINRMQKQLSKVKKEDVVTSTKVEKKKLPPPPPPPRLRIPDSLNRYRKFAEQKEEVSISPQRKIASQSKPSFKQETKKSKPIARIKKETVLKKETGLKNGRPMRKQLCDTSTIEDEESYDEDEEDDEESDTSTGQSRTSVSTTSVTRAKRGLTSGLNRISVKISDQSESESDEGKVSQSNKRYVKKPITTNTSVKANANKRTVVSKADSAQASSMSFAEPHAKKQKTSEISRVPDVHEESKSDNEMDTNSSEINYEVGSKVEVLFNNTWNVGTITSIRPRKKVKVKFDKYDDNKSDKIVSVDSPEFRLYKEPKNAGAHSTATIDSSLTDTTLEVPSSSTSVPSPGSNTNNSIITTTSTTSDKIHNGSDKEKKNDLDTVRTDNLLNDVSNSYRNCLRYFLPPHWLMNKEDVNSLTSNELATFPLSDFVDHYEGGIKKIMDNFHAEVENQKKSTESQEAKRRSAENELNKCNKKLSCIRKMIAKLLKSIHEEFEINSDDDTDKVDDLVKACIQQLPN